MPPFFDVMDVMAEDWWDADGNKFVVDRALYEFFLLDFKDAFYQIPLCEDEQQFFATMYCTIIFIFLG